MFLKHINLIAFQGKCILNTLSLLHLGAEHHELCMLLDFQAWNKS